MNNYDKVIFLLKKCGSDYWHRCDYQIKKDGLYHTDESYTDTGVKIWTKIGKKSRHIKKMVEQLEDCYVKKQENLKWQRIEEKRNQLILNKLYSKKK